MYRHDTSAKALGSGLSASSTPVPTHYRIVIRPARGTCLISPAKPVHRVRTSSPTNFIATSTKRLLIQQRILVIPAGFCEQPSHRPLKRHVFVVLKLQNALALRSHPPFCARHERQASASCGSLQVLQQGVQATRASRSAPTYSQVVSTFRSIIATLTIDKDTRERPFGCACGRLFSRQ